jgi:hypothetical protein
MAMKMVQMRNNKKGVWVEVLIAVNMKGITF